jgi:hypothetical protein
MKTAAQIYMTEKIDVKTASVQSVSRYGGYAPVELITSEELAARWQVPESWVRNRTRVRTPREERIPCVRLGRYVRFEWGSPKLQEWLEKSANND